MWRRRFEYWIVSARRAFGLGVATGTRVTRHVQLRLDALLNVTAGAFYVFVLSVIVSHVFWWSRPSSA